LVPEQHHQREAEQQEQQSGDRVLDSDDFVIGGKDVLAPEAKRFVMGFVRGVRRLVDDSCWLSHAG
jgi:hypothetical protein